VHQLADGIHVKRFPYVLENNKTLCTVCAFGCCLLFGLGSFLFSSLVPLSGVFYFLFFIFKINLIKLKMLLKIFYKLIN